MKLRLCFGVFFLLGVLASCNHAQESSDVLTTMMETVINNQRDLISKFEELQTKVNLVEEQQIEISLKQQEESTSFQQNVSRELSDIKNRITTENSCSAVATSIEDYKCLCPPGYVGNGFRCKDINECADGLQECNQHAKCTKTIGNYACECRRSHVGNRRFCEAINHRYVTDSVVSTLTLSLTECEAHCHENQDCVSFNHQKSTGKCQLINTAPYKENDAGIITALTWSYYTIVPPNPPPLDGSVLCPSNSVLVRYDQPVFLKYDHSLDGYTCTRHPWVVEQYNQGKTNCRMVMMYDLDYRGYDTSYYARVAPYSDALKQCITYNCIGMICKRNNECYLKHETHLSHPIPFIDYKDLLYWYTVCT